jgi:hypothetical protein
MRRLADRLMSLLLRLAPWYRPRDIEAREGRTELVRRHSISARVRAEVILSEYAVAEARR